MIFYVFLVERNMYIQGKIVTISLVIYLIIYLWWFLWFDYYLSL